MRITTYCRDGDRLIDCLSLNSAPLAIQFRYSNVWWTLDNVMSCQSANANYLAAALTRSYMSIVWRLRWQCDNSTRIKHWQPSMGNCFDISSHETGVVLCVQYTCWLLFRKCYLRSEFAHAYEHSSRIYTIISIDKSKHFPWVFCVVVSPLAYIRYHEHSSEWITKWICQIISEFFACS